MNTLNVSPVTDQVSESETVTVGYQITVNFGQDATPPENLKEFAGKPIYGSRSALKAVVKASVLTSEDMFLGWGVVVDPDTAVKAGLENLENLHARAQWDHVKMHAKQEFEPEAYVAGVKQFEPAAVIASGGELPGDPNDEASAAGSEG